MRCVCRSGANTNTQTHKHTHTTHHTPHIRKHTVRLKDSQGHWSEIDVVGGLWRKRYIECKAYSSHAVPLSDVAKFKEVLRLNGAWPARAFF